MTNVNITIDDGNFSQITNFFPILRKHGLDGFARGDRLDWHPWGNNVSQPTYLYQLDS